MQSTEVPNDVESWSDKQVISIPENNLGVEFAKLSRANGFDAALGSYGHEGRGLDHPVSSCEPPRARFCAFIRCPYFKHRRNLGNDRAARKQSIVSVEGRFAWRLFYWTLLALVFAGAIWQRFKLPLDPFADPDTWGYLSPALRKLTGAEFGHTNGRNFVYPGFVFLVLRLFAAFPAITIAQHFLGRF